MTQLNRLRMTYRIGRTQRMIREAIIDYLDSENLDNFSFPEEIRVRIWEEIDGEKVAVEYSCDDIKKKFMLSTPLATLLYMDWLLKDPDAAILYSQQVDMVDVPSREEIEKHIDPRILALAKKKEQEMIQSLESGLHKEIEEYEQPDGTSTEESEPNEI